MAKKVPGEFAEFLAKSAKLLTPIGTPQAVVAGLKSCAEAGAEFNGP